MPKEKYISNKNETVRLFKNNFLEYFSHIHPATPVVVYLPVIAVTFYYGLLRVSPAMGVLLFFAGILLWTITEYSIHRWAFHTEPTSERGKKIHFLVHGVHHGYPRDRTRLVMPLLVSLPLATMFYFLYSWIFGSSFHLIIFSGFVTGYVSYDTIHYATHHWKMKGKIGNWLRVYHLRHHYEDEYTAFGVSNPLWDYVFGTVPKYLIEEKEIKKIEHPEEA